MKKLLKWTASIFVVLLMVALFTDDTSQRTNEGVEEVAVPDCGDRSEAWVFAQQFIKRKLKNPRSAKFAWSYGSEGVSIHQDGCKWTVASYVDATNSYGGTLRSQWAITIKKVHDGWIALDGPKFF